MNYNFGRIAIFCLLILFISVPCAYGQIKRNSLRSPAQQLSFTSKALKLKRTQGTTQQNVHCGLQDKDGNLWFGTTGEGVYRYDGKLFTQFTEKDGLSGNKVWSVLEDESGNIWFGTNNGISLYDGKTITALSIYGQGSNNFFSPMAATQTAKNNAVWSILQTKNGVIWFGTDHGLYCFDGKTFSLFLNNPFIINKNALSLQSVQCMFEEKNGNLWFGSGPMAFEGICFYDGKSLNNFKPENEGWVRKISADKRGMLLFDSRHSGLLAYDGKTFSAAHQPQQLIKDLLNTFFIDSKGNTWYGSDYTNDSELTKGGLWKFDGYSFKEFTQKDGISNTAVYSFTEDKTGNIWIGTRNTGLFRYDGKSLLQFSE